MPITILSYYIHPIQSIYFGLKGKNFLKKRSPIPPHAKVSPKIYASIMLHSLQIDIFLPLVSVALPRDIMAEAGIEPIDTHVSFAKGRTAF